MIITHELSLHTRGHTDVVDITGQVAQAALMGSVDLSSPTRSFRCCGERTAELV